jgi:hypothetical protein
MFLSLIPITSEMMATTVGYVVEVITDLSPLWLLIVAVGIGLIIFEVIVGTIRGRHSS